MYSACHPEGRSLAKTKKQINHKTIFEAAEWMQGSREKVRVCQDDFL
jgi:hypothetical protein